MLESARETRIETRRVAQRDFLVSLALLGLIAVLALGRLALEGNWQKVFRIALAFLTYGAALLSFARYVPSLIERNTMLPWWIFAASAGAAELASGWLRPDWRLDDLVTMPVAAALIGCLHWFTLRMWRTVRRNLGSI